MPNNSIFCGYPDAVIYAEKGADGKTRGKKPLNNLIWGDHLYSNGQEGEWLKVYSRGNRGYIHESKIQKERILEVNFVDVGQGDGVHVVTPNDDAIIIDAGEKENMYRFLRWRYSKNRLIYTQPLSHTRIKTITTALTVSLMKSILLLIT